MSTAKWVLEAVAMYLAGPATTSPLPSIAGQFASGTSETPSQVDADDALRASALMREYLDLPLGFVDATVLAVAERLGAREILTTDRRHFGTVRPSGRQTVSLGAPPPLALHPKEMKCILSQCVPSPFCQNARTPRWSSARRPSRPPIGWGSPVAIWRPSSA